MAKIPTVELDRLHGIKSTLAREARLIKDRPASNCVWLKDLWMAMHDVQSLEDFKRDLAVMHKRYLIRLVQVPSVTAADLATSKESTINVMGINYNALDLNFLPVEQPDVVKHPLGVVKQPAGVNPPRHKARVREFTQVDFDRFQGQEAWDNGDKPVLREVNGMTVIIDAKAMSVVKFDETTRQFSYWEHDTLAVSQALAYVILDGLPLDFTPDRFGIPAVVIDD